MHVSLGGSSTVYSGASSQVIAHKMAVLGLLLLPYCGTILWEDSVEVWSMYWYVTKAGLSKCFDLWVTVSNRNAWAC